MFFFFWYPLIVMASNSVTVTKLTGAKRSVRGDILELIGAPKALLLTYDGQTRLLRFGSHQVAIFIFAPSRNGSLFT